MNSATLALVLASALLAQQGPATRPAVAPEVRRRAAELNEQGIAFKAAGKPKEALEAFRQAAELDPNDPVLARNLGAAWNDEGVRRLERDGNADEAVAAFDEALRRLPGDATAKANKAQALDRRGHAKLAKKQFAAALADFHVACSLAPESSRYPTSVAAVAFAEEKYRSAEVQAEEIVRQFEGETEAWVLLGEARYKQGDVRRALEALERALALAPKRPGLAERIAKIREEAAVEGEFVPQNSEHFQFRFPPLRRDLEPMANEVAAILEEAYWRVGNALGHRPAGRTQVIFYEPKDFGAVTKADEWVGALYDGKIRVPLRDYSSQREALRRTLYHEYTHRVVHSLSANKIPTWLNEGIAQLQEDAPGAAAEAEKRLRDRPEKLLGGAELRAAFVGNADPARARIAYDQSLSLARYLVEQRGWTSIGRYLAAVGDAEKPVAEPQAFEAEFRVSFEEILTRWRLSLGLSEVR